MDGNENNVLQEQQAQQPTIDVNAIAAQLNQTLDSRFNNFEQRMAEQQAQQANKLTPEQIEEMNFKLKEDFDNDPRGFINNITKQAEDNAYNRVKSEYQPIMQEMQDRNNRMMWQENVQNFMQNNPEAQAYTQQMQLILQENPALMGTKDPLGTAYKMATATELMGNGNDLVNNLMANDNYRNQLLNNETLKNQIIQNYQNGLNGMAQSNNLPPLMGNNQTGSAIPASTGEMPRNLKEARISALRRFGNQ